MKSIGGYFSLEVAHAAGAHPGRLGLQRLDSARSAFHLLLQAGRPRRVLLPWYQCPAMSARARALGIAVSEYALDADGMPPAGLQPAEDEWLVLVDYFGVRGAAVQASLQRLPRERVIVDQAQAWHAPLQEAAATLYSPRKFAGLPDGGLLATSVTLAAPLPADEAASRSRLEALRLRSEGRDEEGLQAYQRGEASLDADPPRAMSRLTADTLDAIDFQALRRRRVANYARLSTRLGAHDRLGWPPGAGDVPLCFPLLHPDGYRLRIRLAESRIYCARYWPGLDGAAAPGWERQLPRDLLCLPVDHRYDGSDMDRIADAVESAIG